MKREIYVCVREREYIKELTMVIYVMIIVIATIAMRHLQEQ